jgi:hypothetical protein
MRKSALAAGLMAALVGGTGPAFAFQETPEAPPDALSLAPKPSQDPAMPLQTPSTGPGPDQPAEKGGSKLFGFTLLPKLDFGLELLYSAPQSSSLELQQGTLPDDDDLTVVGKVKRHF